MANKSLSSQAAKAAQRVIEGNKGAVTHGKKGKEAVPAKQSPVVKIGIGSRIGECISALYGKASTGLREAIQSLQHETVETREQALKELRHHQYKAQCLAAGKTWKQGMVPSDFMHKAGTLIFKRQRSIAANYSRAIGIVKALAEGRNITKICESTDITEMYALASRRGGERKDKKPMSDGQFKQYLEKLPLICLDHKNEDQVKHLEMLVVQAFKLAEKHSIALSDPVKRMLGIEEKKTQRKAA